MCSDVATKSFVCWCAFWVSFKSKRESLGVGVLYILKLRDWNPNMNANELYFELSMSVFHQRETILTMTKAPKYQASVKNVELTAHYSPIYDECQNQSDKG